jgi:hypothetical protein
MLREVRTELRDEIERRAEKAERDAKTAAKVGVLPLSLQPPSIAPRARSHHFSIARLFVCLSV